MKILTLKRKIPTFKMLPHLKDVYLKLITCFLAQFVTKIKVTLKPFAWSNATPKLKYGTLCNNFVDGGLRSILINTKILKNVYKLHSMLYFKWRRIIYLLPNTRKYIFKKIEEIVLICFALNKHLVTNNQIISFVLSLYISVLLLQHLTFNLKKVFSLFDFQWKGVHTLTWKVIIYVYLRAFF